MTKRIDDMLEAIRDVWEEHPNLRLGQLIMIALGEYKPVPSNEYFMKMCNETGVPISTQILMHIKGGYMITPIHSGDIFGVPDKELLLQIRKTKVRLGGK